MSGFGVRPQSPMKQFFRFIPFVLVFAVCFSGSLLLIPGNANAATGQVLHEGEFRVEDLRWEADVKGIRYPALDGTRLMDEPGLPQLRCGFRA